MIKGLMGSRGVVVDGGNTAVPYVNQNQINPCQGMIRVWGTDMQVFDGTNWMNIMTNYATVSLDPTIHEAIDWTRRKMQEEKDLHDRMKKHPGLRQAYEQFQIMDILTLEEKHGQEA
jgi:hypothetical protein